MVWRENKCVSRCESKTLQAKTYALARGINFLGDKDRLPFSASSHNGLSGSSEPTGESQSRILLSHTEVRAERFDWHDAKLDAVIPHSHLC